LICRKTAGVGVKYTYMADKKYNQDKDSKFQGAIRIDKKQLKWLDKNKDCRTMSGFLDKIINYYKKKKHDTRAKPKDNGTVSSV
jgi:hypothetical protein